MIALMQQVYKTNLQTPAFKSISILFFKITNVKLQKQNLIQVQNLLSFEQIHARQVAPLD